MSKHVRIENPAPGGSDYTSVNRARRFVSKGRAAWIVQDRSMRFLAASEMRRAAAVPVDAKVRETAILAMQRELTGRQYDKIVPTGQITQRQAKHIPFAGDVRLLGLRAG